MAAAHTPLDYGRFDRLTFDSDSDAASEEDEVATTLDAVRARGYWLHEASHVSRARAAELGKAVTADAAAAGLDKRATAELTTAIAELGERGSLVEDDLARAFAEAEAARNLAENAARRADAASVATEAARREAVASNQLVTDRCDWRWEDDDDEVCVSLSVASSTAKDDVHVTFAARALTVAVRSDNAFSVVLAGELFDKVDVDECTWTISRDGATSGARLVLSLAKDRTAHPGVSVLWPALFALGAFGANRGSLPS